MPNADFGQAVWFHGSADTGHGELIPSGYDLHSHREWPIYRWFSQLETSIYGGFSMAMLNNQMVYIIGVSKGGVLTLIPAVCPTDTASRFLCEIKAPSLSARVASRH